MDPVSHREPQWMLKPAYQFSGVEKAAASGRTSKAAAADEEPALDAMRESVDSIARSLDSYLKRIQTDLQVEIHRKTNTPIFKIIRRSDGQVIKEVPPREMLEIAAKIKDMLGAMLDSRA